MNPITKKIIIPNKALNVRNGQASRWIIALLLAVLVGGLSGFIVYMFWHSHREIGQYGISDIYPSENLHKSLDLKLALRAKYPSGPIRVVKELGSGGSVRQRLVSFEVKNDDLVEYALVMQPVTEPPPQGYPVLILIHGYMQPRSYTTDFSYTGDMSYYAENGFMVIKPDLRGQGESINAGSPDSAYYSMSYNTDIMSLISAVKQTRGVDKSNINLWGHSMGAYIALRAAVLSDGIKNTILLAAPVDSLETMYLTYIPPSDENNPLALATRVEVFSKYGTPTENQRFWYDASPINFVSRIKGNVQIHAGLLDGLVPPEFSVSLRNALSRSKISHQYYDYPYGGHSLIESRPDIYQRSLEVMTSDFAEPRDD